MPTFPKLLIVYVVIGFLLVLFGSIMLGMSEGINYVKVRYDNRCSIGQSAWSVTFTPTSTIKSPKLYYEIENFYGNHRNYIKSRNFYQLRGNTDDVDVDKCSPIEKAKDVSTTLTNLNGAALDQNSDANPCGLIAKYRFTDTYTLWNSGTQMTIDETGIAHSIDKNSRFKRPDNYRDVQWADTGDEHLMVWFQIDAFPTFRKLWGKINTDLQAGTQYEIQVNNNWDVSNIDAKKYFYISETTVFGGQNPVFGIIYLAGGGLFLILAVVMIVLYIVTKKKRSEDDIVHNF